jgi:hypothetical protein
MPDRFSAAFGIVKEGGTFCFDEERARPGNLCGLGPRTGSDDVHGSFGVNPSRSEYSLSTVTQSVRQDGTINHDRDSAI